MIYNILCFNNVVEPFDGTGFVLKVAIDLKNVVDNIPEYQKCRLMKYGNLILEKRDYLKLKRILNFHRYYEDYVHKDALERLKERINKALIQDEDEVPDDIVRLNSKVTVLSKDMGSQNFYLVSPSEEDIKQGNVSVISTLGAKLIGLAVDDNIQIGVPSDFTTFKITKVERSNDLSSSTYFEIDF